MSESFSQYSVPDSEVSAPEATGTLSPSDRLNRAPGVWNSSAKPSSMPPTTTSVTLRTRSDNLLFFFDPVVNQIIAVESQGIRIS